MCYIKIVEIKGIEDAKDIMSLSERPGHRLKARLSRILLLNFTSEPYF